MNKPTLPLIRTERLTLKLLEPVNAELMVRFRVENREHLSPWEPLRAAEFFTKGFWEMQLRHAIQEFREGKSVCLVIMDADETEVLGVCNFTYIQRGTFLACHLGYALAEKHQGRGIMSESLQAGVDYMFGEVGLHRIMANYMPCNDRSARVLERLGFVIEGKAKDYLQINGRWEDHILTSLVNPAV
jgi:ribosomal-protein-alanine N-acetyltransferase